MESAKVSQPAATPEIMTVKEENQVHLHDDKFLCDLSRLTMVTIEGQLQ